MSDWNPRLYLKFESERIRAGRDLLARVPLSSARTIHDLGCGPGNSSELLAQRYPRARITGIDTSAAMLAQARLRAPQIQFINCDIAAWEPEEPTDLIFANAALHFLPDHDRLLPRLASYLAPGGCLAVQMPDVTRESSHALMRMVAAEGPWASRIVPIAKTRPIIADAESYYAWLHPLCDRLDIWMTTYIHALDGAQGIADWFEGSALQPYLERLDDDERGAFLKRYREGLAESYPLQADGRALLHYPRLFLVALREESGARRRLEGAANA